MSITWHSFVKMVVKGLYMKSLYTIILVSSIAAGLSSCKSAEKVFREGDYNQAIEICIQKLTRNPEKEEYILVLEEAFKRANTADLNYIYSLNLEGNPDRWEEIYDVYQGISRRQNRISPLLPLFVHSENRYANFEMVDVVAELINAKKNAINFLLASAKQKLAGNDKYAARDAYNELIRIQDLSPNQPEIKTLIQEAVAKGTNYVVYAIENKSNSTLSGEVADALFSVEPGNTQGKWFSISGYNNNAAYYDMTVVLRVKKVEALPEALNTNNYEETKQVEDGWTYLYDTQGNKVLDSLGNPVKTTKYKWISAYVSETMQQKIATVEAEIRYLDAKGKLLGTIPVKGDGIFQNYYAIATGYYDALTPASREKIGGQPMPFPTDNALLLLAISNLETVIQQAMQDNNAYYLNQ